MDSYLERLQLAITSATRGMKVEDLGSRPQGYPVEKWSVAEILEHLYLTYTGTSKGFERCLQAGKPLVSPITLKQRARITVVTGLGYLPSGRKAPERSIPKGMPGDKVMAEIGSRIKEMDDLMRNAKLATGRGLECSTIPCWGRLRRGNGESFTGCTDGIM